MNVHIMHTLVVAAIGIVVGSLALTLKILKWRRRIPNTMGAFILELTSTIISGGSLVVALCIMP